MKKIIASNRFLKFKKHSPSQLQLEIDQQVKLIAKDPDIGELKKGDLKGIRVYKFKFKAQQYLLSYEVLNDILFLYLTVSEFPLNSDTVHVGGICEFPQGVTVQ